MKDGFHRGFRLFTGRKPQLEKKGMGRLALEDDLSGKLFPAVPRSHVLELGAGL